MADINPQGTQISPIPQMPEDDRTEEQKCNDEGIGWFWDATTQNCIQKPTEPEPVAQTTPPPVTLGQPEIIRGETGQMTGITTPEGPSYLGLPAKEIRNIAGKDLEKRELPAGTQEAGTAQAEQERQIEALALQAEIQRIDQIPIGQLTPTDLTNRQTYQAALLGGAQAAGIGAVGTATTAAGLAFAGGKIGAVGGAAGGPIGVGAGAAIGAGIGLVSGAAIGAWRAWSGNIKSQAVGYEQQKRQIAMAVRRDMTKSLSTMWSGRGNNQELVDDIRERYLAGKTAWGQLMLDTSQDIQLRREVDGTKTLAQFEQMYAENGELQALLNEAEAALFAPPNEMRAMQLMIAAGEWSE